jgi:adenylate cyclase
MNQGRGEGGPAPLGFGIGLHIGDVLYGNIGVPERLEFTVIGAAANTAARLEGLCKTLDIPVLISAEFAGFFPGELASVGRHGLRGVANPQEIFTLPDLLDRGRG